MEALTEDILTHLDNAEEHLAEIFGMADWMNVMHKNRVIADTHETSRKGLVKELGEAQYEAIAHLPLEEIPKTCMKEFRVFSVMKPKTVFTVIYCWALSLNNG